MLIMATSQIKDNSGKYSAFSHVEYAPFFSREYTPFSHGKGDSTPFSHGKGDSTPFSHGKGDFTPFSHGKGEHFSRREYAPFSSEGYTSLSSEEEHLFYN